MKPSDPPDEGKYNNPMMPVAWTNAYKAENGTTARVFTTTMGASEDIESEGMRRLLVNAAFWALGMESQIGEHSACDLVGPFKATRYSFKGYVKDVKPSSLKLDAGK
jgi:hypothetical protein